MRELFSKSSLNKIIIMKYLVVLCDGMADEKIEELGGQTPMEAAVKPTMNYLAARSLCGTALTVPPSMEPESDTANLSILSYDPLIYSHGRSPLEALSIGLSMNDTQTAIRCNLVTLSEEDDIDYTERTILDHSSDEITTEEANELIQALEAALGNDDRHFYTGISYRHCLLWDHAPTPIDFARPHNINGQIIGGYLPTAPDTDGYAYYELMRRSYDILNHHPINEARRAKGLKPANSIWLWSPGTKPALPSFEKKWKIRASVISAVDLIKGIAICAGMESLDVEGATGNFDTNYAGKGQAAIDAFKRGQEFIYVHIEAPDECGHRGEAENKKRCIELIDEQILKPVYDYLKSGKDDFKILVLPDHPTPVRTRGHARGAVPFFLYDSRCEVKGISIYSEEACAGTGLYIESGERLMELMFSKKNPSSIASEFGIHLSKRASSSSLLDWAELLGASLAVVILLMTFIMRHSPVIGCSMYPTLIGKPANTSDYAYTKEKGYDVLLISNLFYTPKYGDIVIIQLPEETEEPLVKRIIATEGQTIRIQFDTWRVWVDGVLLDESYIHKIEGTSMASLSLQVTNGVWEGTVPEGCIFVMGDNRNNSRDSRSIGYIDTRYLVGRVVTRISPLDRLGKVE